MMQLLNRFNSFRSEIGRQSGKQFSHQAKALPSAVLAVFVAVSCVALNAPALANGKALKSTFPRIGAIEIAGTHDTVKPEYRQALAKHDIVILGMWRGWSGRDSETNEQLRMRDVVVDIKNRAAQDGNGGILIGKYTIFMESGSDGTPGSASYDRWTKLHSEVGPGYATNNDWWARNSNGENVGSYPGSWNTNVTEFVQRDSNGDTWPEWAATRAYEVYFRDVPEMDIWYIDNWFYRPRVTADWDGDGTNDDRKSDFVGREYRKGFINGLRRARQLAPNMIVMGNVDGEPQISKGMLTEPEYRGQVAALYEGAMGMTWSQETWGTWETMMEQYQTTLQNAKDRLLIMTVHGDATDYKAMRYGLASCLMDDGFYYYTSHDREFRSALWFDEYDVDLGRPIDPPQFSAWQKGVYRRRFENGMVLVNPKGNGTQTLAVEPGYKRIAGTQDTRTNSGQSVNSLQLAERDGIVLVSTDSSSRINRPKPPVIN